MFPTTHTTQIFTPFGSGYVPMQHNEPTSRNLPADLDDLVEALRASLFSEMLQSLRAALSLR
jgi:hypothetical protein